ncbi:MAG: gamma-glutamyl-gamma-aminobutyrate hydrolase family protein [Bacteroidota bacterium]
MRIGITDTMGSRKKFDYYVNWIHRIDPGVELVTLSYRNHNVDEISKVEGLLLTGGGDVHPGYYGMGEEIGRAKEIDERRDGFEFDLIERALDQDLPILGICRGMQVMNVYLGGSLILDLASSGYGNHSPQKGFDSEHTVHVAAQSMLGALTGASELTVNSSHHQAVDRLGNGLMVSATSPDGVIEAAEWILKDRMPFLMLVQWHPERMNDPESQASKILGKRFLEEIRYSMNEKAPSPSTHFIVK